MLRYAPPPPLTKWCITRARRRRHIFPVVLEVMSIAGHGDLDVVVRQQPIERGEFFRGVGDVMAFRNGRNVVSSGDARMADDGHENLPRLRLRARSSHAHCRASSVRRMPVSIPSSAKSLVCNSKNGVRCVPTSTW